MTTNFKVNLHDFWQFVYVVNVSTTYISSFLHCFFSFKTSQTYFVTVLKELTYSKTYYKDQSPKDEVRKSLEQGDLQVVSVLVVLSAPIESIAHDLALNTVRISLKCNIFVKNPKCFT